MPYDRDEFIAGIAARRKETVSAQMPLLRQMAAVAPVLERLQTGGDWDRYLQFLAGLIEKAETRKAAAQQTDADPTVWDPQQRTKLKCDILVADAYIAAWRIAMELPKALIEGGEKAMQAIAEFEKKNGQPADVP